MLCLLMLCRLELCPLMLCPLMLVAPELCLLRLSVHSLCGREQQTQVQLESPSHVCIQQLFALHLLRPHMLGTYAVPAQHQTGQLLAWPLGVCECSSCPAGCQMLSPQCWAAASTPQEGSCLPGLS